jgi:ParB-like chromosome segregation protein Spo0J
MEYRSIAEIKSNPKNPRIIKDDKFAKLVKSIRDFPQMLEKRPLVCFTDTDGKLVVLGGNMRLKAAKEVGLKQLPVVLADDWNEEQKNEFLIKDNVGFGEWQWDELANEWDAEQLSDWGLDVPDVMVIDGKEIPIDEDFEPATELGIQKEYLVIVFENEDEHKEAIEKFGLKKQREVNNEKIELNNVGIQRVIKYEDMCTFVK